VTAADFVAASFWPLAILFAVLLKTVRDQRLWWLVVWAVACFMILYGVLWLIYGESSLVDRWRLSGPCPDRGLGSLVLFSLPDGGYTQRALLVCILTRPRFSRLGRDLAIPLGYNAVCGFCAATHRARRPSPGPSKGMVGCRFTSTMCSLYRRSTRESYDAGLRGARISARGSRGSRARLRIRFQSRVSFQLAQPI
jgi:hypothetical protein